MASHLHSVDSTNYGENQMRSYIIGFILSIILTILPYYMVVNHLFEREALLGAIVILAILQLLVQLIFFLHLGDESKPRWNLITFVFAIIVVGVVVFGSIWIMNNLDYNMMH